MMSFVPDLSPHREHDVRVGVIGVGAMGAHHAENLLRGLVPGLVLAAVSDPSETRLEAFAPVPGFRDWRELLAARIVDAVVVATPHFSHLEIGRAALTAGLHVLMEKPLTAHKADCERLLACPRRDDQLFAVMLNQRGDPAFQKIRELVSGGELGRVQRVHWTVTDWFRTDVYYRSSPWRATWAGEGGGLLINQACHNLDLYQWIFGMPVRVMGRCGFGQYHDIETEDEVTAWFEHADGLTGGFIASTGESPGSNRLEILGDCGRLVLEDWKLILTRNAVSASKVRRTAVKPDERPATQTEELLLAGGRGLRQLGVLQNFGRALMFGEALIAPAEEGLPAVELANAIQMAAQTGGIVDLPLDAARYAALLQARIDTSPRTAELARAGVPIPRVSEDNFLEK